MLLWLSNSTITIVLWPIDLCSLLLSQLQIDNHKSSIAHTNVSAAISTHTAFLRFLMTRVFIVDQYWNVLTKQTLVMPKVNNVKNICFILILEIFIINTQLKVCYNKSASRNTLFLHETPNFNSINSRKFS